MTNTRLKNQHSIIATLTEERRKLVIALEKQKKDPIDGEPRDDMSENAQYLTAQHEYYSELERKSREIGRIDIVLEKVNKGEFGSCEDCGSEIPFERLEATDWKAIRCGLCQEEVESMQPVP